MPKSIPEVFSSASAGVNNFERNSRNAKSLGRFVLPVRLCDLLPHHDIKTPTGLVAKHKAGIVIISVCVYIHGSTEVHCIELIKPCNVQEYKVHYFISREPAECHLLQDVCSAHLRQCQGQSWQSGPALCPGAWPPSWDRFGLFP